MGWSDGRHDNRLSGEAYSQIMRTCTFTYITGYAGTGKTTTLMKLAGELSETLIVHPEFQSLLAITRMHGARRRIDSLLHKEHPNIPVRVTTIDSFSLSIVNRWRRSLGYGLPIVVDPQIGGLGERYGAHHASFAEVLEMALKLLDSPCVKAFIAATHPLIIVDEFQECNADAMSLICKLADVSKVVLAADGFQDLSSGDDTPCEAISWLERCEATGATHIDLSIQHRTVDNRILHTAHCLRHNVQPSFPTIEKYACPTVPMLAWKIVQAYLSKQIKGTCAVICLAADSQLDAMLVSVNKQLADRGLTKGIRWTRIQTSDQEKKAICGELGISHEPHSAVPWKLEPEQVRKLGPRATLIHSKIIKFGKLTGREGIYTDLVSQFAQAGLHADRSYSPLTGRFEVTTVYGAKNREFDHVFIFWGYRLPPEKTRRKMLYNAVTRAKRSCVLLVQQSKPQLIKLDPALALLGDFPPPFESGKKRSTSKKVSSKKVVRKGPGSE
jgi:hypothetical protein